MWVVKVMEVVKGVMDVVWTWSRLDWEGVGTGLEGVKAGMDDRACVGLITALSIHSKLASAEPKKGRGDSR